MPPKRLGLVGLLIAFLVALPIFVWSIINLNFNPKEKASEVVQLSICGDSCNATNICLNEEPWPQELICYPEDADNGLCRNKACPDQPNCICPAPTTTPTATPTTTPTATPTATATSTPGIPNYCGGTCGSNFNCQANYYCFQGFCRNPVCPSDSNCDCIANATVTATPKRTVTPKPTKTATAKSSSTPIGNITTNYKTTTSKSTATSSPTLHPALVEKELKNQFLVKYALPIFGIFALIVISTIFYALKKNKDPNNIPHISPPTNI